MPSESEGQAVARARIAEEKEKRTGFLDLGRLGLTELPDELFDLKDLWGLNLGFGWRDQQGEWHAVGVKLAPNQPRNIVSTLRLFAGLTHLSLAGMDVADLVPLAGLKALRSVVCDHTRVSDLSPLAHLQALQSLDCSGTQVSDLSPLANLEALQSLDCSGTQVSDLSPLANLEALQSLGCSGTQVSDLSPLADLQGLRSLDCSGTQVSDLSPLAGLQALQSLVCDRTQVSDLSPLAHLQALQSLVCDGTQVSDLSPLADLQELRSLDCSRTQVSDLSPLGRLQALQFLDCCDTQVSDLSPLAHLQAIQSLDCSGTQVSDLSPLADLQRLRSLQCSRTQVSDLSPLADLQGLRSLHCSRTEVSDLSPLDHLEALQSLVCWNTPVNDLSPLARLPALRSVDCDGTRVEFLPEALAWLKSLEDLNLYGTRITEIPAEVLSRHHGDNCLERLRAHLRDLEAGGERLPDVKVLVLGNGRIGKTQICRRLRGEAFEENADSTHGIVVTSAMLPMSQSVRKARRPHRKKGGPAACNDEEALLHLWDFGGQDLYHGTHALFMRTRSLFILVWTPTSENTSAYGYGGMTFRNHPLAYWLEYVRHLSGTNSPLLIVQNMCDRAADEMLHPPVQGQALQDFASRKVLHYSALKDRGRAALDEALQQAIQWLRENTGQAQIGRGRLAVKRKLEALRDQDASVRVENRKYRTLTQAFFHQLCAEAGGVSSPEMLLDYLHHTGIVFYRRGLFDDRIVLDQGWALEAVYAVFDRQKSYRQLHQLGGRFNRSLLEALVWQAYRVEEQELFLSLMTSCGVCFVHRRGNDEGELETEYIAPDLLPDREAVAAEIEAMWGEPSTGGTLVVELPFLHPGIMRGIVSKIGQAAGISALYWKYGACLYEKTTRSRALIEQSMNDLPNSWSGQIAVSTQSGQSAELLRRLQEWIEVVIEQSGCRDWKIARTPETLTPTHEPEDSRTRSVVAGSPTIAPESNLEFAPLPSDKKTYCVSYAWNDESKAKVDELCDEARRRGIEILRDKTGTGRGESITRFMQKLGAGDRVFVILSEKYLKSAYCMYELLEVWRNCRMEDEVFRKRVRVYRLPDAKMSSPLDRTLCAKYWKEQFTELDTLVREHGPNLLGHADFQRYKLMQDFSNRVGDMLALIADTLFPKDFEELKKHGFAD